MSSKLVERRLNDFKRRCGNDGDIALQLAYHAAMPVALNPELLHFLRINFFLDPPEQLTHTVEFEFLTSGLCREIDAELYEIEPEIRNELLQRLMRRKDARQRIRDVATLLWQYVEYHSPWADRVQLERAQQLTALNFLNPAKAKQWLEEAKANPSVGRGEQEWFIAMRQEIEELPDFLDNKPVSPKFDVFLCHNSEDKEAVIKIAEQLKYEYKIEPWLDEWELRPGFPWQAELEKQIAHIESAAVFVGKSGIAPWQEDEIYAFLREFKRRKCPVIPVLLPDAPQKPQLPLFLEGITWVDFREQTRVYTPAMDQLIWGITGIKPQPIVKNVQVSQTDILSSERDVNYTQLRDLLAAGKWKEAHEETLAVMLKASGREKDSWLDTESIENFPCTDLRTIDQLWVKYSNGRFGFSVQKRIWESVGGKPNADYETFEKFGDRVGWLVKNKLLDHKDLQLNLNAPLGHLPSHIDLIGFDSLGGSLFSRVQTCEVEATKVSENG